MRSKLIHVFVLACILFAGVYLAIGPEQNVVPAAAQGVGTNKLKGWAWSENIGWISMNCDQVETQTCLAQGGNNYWVSFDKPTGVFSGYAWSDNVGWISFNTADVNGDTALKRCPVYSASIDNCTPTLDMTTSPEWTMKGWARVLAADPTRGWDGWINFSSTTYASNKYAVTFVPATSKASTSSYAWGSDVMSWISFAPKLNSDTVPIPELVYFSDPLSTKTAQLSVTAGRAVYSTTTSVTVNVRVEENSILDSSITGNVTVRASVVGGSQSASASINQTVGDVLVPITNGTGSFILRDTVGEKLNVAVVNASFSAGYSSIPVNFGEVVVTAQTNPLAQRGASTNISYSLYPAGLFTSCTRSSPAGSTSGWDISTGVAGDTRTISGVIVNSTPATVTVSCSYGGATVDGSLDLSYATPPQAYISSSPTFGLGTVPVRVSYWGSSGTTNCTASSTPVTTGWNGPIGDIFGYRDVEISANTVFGLRCTDGVRTSNEVRASTVVRTSMLQMGEPAGVELSSSINATDNPNLLWTKSGRAVSWSCKGTKGDDASWLFQNLSGTSAFVENVHSGKQTYEITCTDPSGTESVSDTANVGVGIEPLINSVTVKPIISFVSDKEESSNPVPITLVSNPLGPIMLSVESPKYPAFIAGFRKNGIEHLLETRTSTIVLGDSELSAGVTLVLTLKNRPVFGDDEIQKTYPVVVTATSLKDDKSFIASSTTLQLTVKKITPTFKEN